MPPIAGGTLGLDVRSLITLARDSFHSSGKVSCDMTSVLLWTDEDADWLWSVGDDGLRKAVRAEDSLLAGIVNALDMVADKRERARIDARATLIFSII